MTDNKIVETLLKLGYKPFKDDATTEEIQNAECKDYCVYYQSSIRRQDQRLLHKIYEFVFVNETDGEFNEVNIVDELEKIGLTLDGDGEYGKLKKVDGGDIVNSLTLRFARPLKRGCIF